jgi:hypothetical protein
MNSTNRRMVVHHNQQREEWLSIAISNLFKVTEEETYNFCEGISGEKTDWRGCKCALLLLSVLRLTNMS